MTETQIMPVSLKDKLEMANVFVKSNLMPRGLDTPEKVVIALEMGHELGLPPLVAIMNIAVINNMPTLKADMMVALALRSGKVEDIRINFSGNEQDNDDDFGCLVTIKRKDIATPFMNSFTRRDAKVAGLFNKDNWRKYERRMLKHRAIAFCIRDALPEIFSGIYLPDEMEDVTEVTSKITTQNESLISQPEQVPEEETDEIATNLEKNIEPISAIQIRAIKSLAGSLFSPGIIESYLYDQYLVNRVELLDTDTAGEIIMMLQNNPEVVTTWLEQNYQNTA